MLASILQSTITVILAAALLYLVFSNPRYVHPGLKTNVVLGGVFGLVIIALSLNAYVPSDGPMLSAVLGVLIYAGYIGKWPGALIALLVALGIRIWVGGALLPISMVSLAGHALIGPLLRWLAPFENWPEPPKAALYYGLATFFLFKTAVVGIAQVIGVTPPIDDFPRLLLTSYSVSSASIVLTWLAIHQSVKLASIVRDNANLLQRIRLFSDNNRMGTYSFDQDRRRLVIDQGMLDIYGLNGKPGEFPVDAILGRIHPDDKAAVDKKLAQLTFEKSDPAPIDFRAYRIDGSLRDIRAVHEVEPNQDTGKLRIVGVHIDLTDIRQAERQRKEAEHRLAMIARNVPGTVIQSIWENGTPRDLTFISEKCVEIWGISQAEIMADPYLLTANESEEDKKRANDAFIEGIRTGKPIRVRLPVHGRDDILRWVDLHAQTTDQGDGTHRVDAILVDVSAEVAAREHARRQEDLAHRSQKLESIGQLTGGVAHDFNNILAVIMGNLELLREETQDQAKLGMIDAGLEASHRGADLTRNMLAFARRARLSPEPLDLNTLVRQAKNWMRRALPESVEIETSLLAGLWTAKADAASLESALLNLILNARDAMDGHGKLTIETANVRIDQAYVDARDETLEPGRYVMLAVSDTGTGIDGETLERMFEPFYTTKEPGAGSGLGLSMVLGFVKQSGGTVQVYTEPDQGTTFKLYFPVSDEAQRTERPRYRDIPAPAVQKSRILLAEDEIPVRDVLIATLDSAGYDVVDVGSGDAALAVFRRDPTFDLLITDIVMPGELQGTSLARAIRETHPDLPMIFMSGYATEATVHGNGLRAEDIRLMKPVPRADLLAAVARALSAATKQSD